MKKKSNQTRAGGRILVPKWMMKMKVVFILLVCSLVQVQAAVSARQSKVSVELKNVTLEKVFQELEEFGSCVNHAYHPLCKLIFKQWFR